MSRRTLATALLCLVPLTACGTGLHARTYQETGRADGASINLGGASGVAVRDLHVEPPASGSTFDVGGTALVTGALVNNGTTPDQLLSATSDAAGSVTLQVGGSTTNAIDIPSLGMAPQDWALQLDGLTRSIPAGTYIGVTLVFAHAGHVDLQVPVRAGDNGLSSRTPAQDPYSEK